uniref:Uncharacterized protein n=1 Tax=Rhizophora mucronata TaxID=61149 RepID=A0A2P2P8G4_RHIMU
MPMVYLYMGRHFRLDMVERYAFKTNFFGLSLLSFIPPFGLMIFEVRACWMLSKFL